MQANALRFYQFSGAHALLIGLLPFYLPALLWQQQHTLADISLFIALSGASYTATLALWDRCRARGSFRALVVASFALATALAVAIVLDPGLEHTHFSAVLYGAYGCFYWMTQRLLFVECSQAGNTGRRFGNAQILVTVLLKVGILSGGLLWDRFGAHSVLWATLTVCSLAALVSTRLSWPPLSKTPAATFTQLSALRDRHRSRSVFVADGLFLFAESFFWVVTLYHVAEHNLTRLGLLVVALSALLAGVFYLIKNRLDNANPQRIFVLAVVGYAASWLLRAWVDTVDASALLYPIIVLVAFLTALFRLVFNKRFFDIARRSNPSYYLVAKSHWSQAALALLYTLCAFTLFSSSTSDTSLPLFYALLAPLSLVFLRYRLGSRTS